jgi:hypothetical protein
MAKIFLVIICSSFLQSLLNFSSKRLAPSDWQEAPVTITRRYLPFWSFSLKGSVYAEAYVRKNLIDQKMTTVFRSNVVHGYWVVLNGVL